MNIFKELEDLHSVGPATIKDLKLLSITTPKQLLDETAEGLYERLCWVTASRHDPCVIDVFRAAIEQVKNPALEREKCNWWYWTKVRKGALSPR